MYTLSHLYRWPRHSVRQVLHVALAFTFVTSAAAIRAHAATVPAAAVAAYQAGLAVKASNPTLALQDFRTAVRLDPSWEPPLYEEGALLAVSDFSAALPVLRQAAHVAPQDATVWNILGWGYYKEHDFAQAESDFSHQLHLQPNSGPGLWGLANCYANSTVRAFAKARTVLERLRTQPVYGPLANRLLADLPPDAVDGSYQPNAPVTYEDAIAMILSWRTAALHFPVRPVVAQNHKAPDSDVAAYISYAAAQGWLASVRIPSFQAPATRLGLALLFAQAYGINMYDYIRPFALLDMGSVPIDEQMLVNSMLATRLMSMTTPGYFSPDSTVPRHAFAQMVQNANAIMVKPPNESQLLTPALPTASKPPVLYVFSTGSPSISTQDADLAAHSQAITAVGLTDYPFAADFPAGSAAVRERADGTKYLLTADSAGPAVRAQLAQIQQSHIGAFMVLANYDNITHKSDPAIVDEMIGTSNMRRALTAQVVHIVQQEALSGVTVDFENIAAKDRVAYVAFLRDLAEALHAIGKKVMVCLPERYQSDDGASPYDYAALGQYADWVMLITYDEHVPEGPPGAIATLSNTQRVIQYAVQQIAPSKILLGMADYGYDWSGGQGVEVSMSEAQALAAQYHATIHVDPISDTPTFRYTDASGIQHTVWFEDDASLQAVEGLIQLYGLAGAAVWHLGSEDTGFWQVIHAITDRAQG